MANHTMANRAIDRMVDHFRSTKNTRHEIPSKAWGFSIWVSPWVLGEKDRVFGSDPIWRPRSNARLLIVKAEDEKGNSLFADVEETELLTEVDPDEIVRVAGRILSLLNADNAAARPPGDEPPKD